MSNLIAFNANNLPAHLQAAMAANVESAFSAGISSGGFPVLSIKGKIFTLVEDGERKIIMKPDEDDEPATALELVFVAANPNRSRVWYSKGFEDGVTEKPDCYSEDGTVPASDSKNKQAKACATCPHSIKGSGQNGKGTACSLSRKTVVCAGGHLDKPMMLRVPNASTYQLADYDRSLRGIPMQGVITKVKFVPEEATPKLDFKAVNYLSAEQFAQVQALAKTDTVAQMLGLKPMPKTDDPEDEFVANAPAHLKAPEAEAKVAKPAAKAVAKAEPKVEAAPAEVKPKAKPAPVQESSGDEDLLSELDDLLGSTDD